MYANAVNGAALPAWLGRDRLCPPCLGRVQLSHGCSQAPIPAVAGCPAVLGCPAAGLLHQPLQPFFFPKYPVRLCAPPGARPLRSWGGCTPAGRSEQG